VQKLQRQSKAAEKFLLLFFHAEMRIRESAKVAGIRLGRENFVREIGQAVEQAAIRIVDKDKGGFHLVALLAKFF
jgi:hypothetical protein